MKITIDILNPESINSGVVLEGATWHLRTKSYETDWLDDDVINCTVGKVIDRIMIDNVQLGSKASIEDLIKLLTNAKESLRY